MQASDPPNVLSLAIAPEVVTARQERRAVVALESTILSHGLPYPASLAVGREIEARVRENGAVPATIALLDGAMRVGLGDADLERVARGGIDKLQSRDLGAAIAQKRSGGTTVSATMVIAARAGISVFATGGIGGVHRELAVALDVSADLTELARTKVAVVCAGPKSILDIPATAEVLETLGVPVIGFGTDELPAFHYRASGVGVSARADDARGVAEILRAHFALGQGGALVVVPPPAAHAFEPAEIDGHIEAALSQARERGITGKAVTPFLLAELARVTAGRTVEVNRALVLNNATVAAGIAVALAG